MTTYGAVIASPVGDLLLESDGRALVGLRFGAADGTTTGPRDAVVETAAGELAAYFAGELLEFTVPVAGRGTAFQRRVWAALRDIPYGETESYGQLAARLGDPRANRAVGLANGRNPVAIVLPCHRVIGSTGALTGYGGGMARKRWLLDHEAAVLARRGKAAVLF